MKTIPTIRIKNAWLLRAEVSVHLNELWGDGIPLESEKFYKEKTEIYKNAWQPYEQKILLGMSEIFGLTFRQSEIDVYIAPWFAAFSDPMIIGTKYDPNRFVEVLSHELLHRLITDNTTYHDGDILLKIWKDLFGDQHSKNTLIHIPVHAGLKAIFLDVLNEPQRLENDISLCAKWDHYRNAWEYVQENDYKQIIQKLKESYLKVSIPRTM